MQRSQPFLGTRRRNSGVKKSSSLKRSKAIAAAGTLALAAYSVQAADVYWDVDATSGNTPGTSTWDVNNTAAWSNSTSPGTTAPSKWVNGNNARFDSNGTNIVTVSSSNGQVIVGSIFQSFNGITTTIGGASLQMGNGTSAGITTSAGNSMTINSALVLNGDLALAATIGTTIGGNISEMGGARSVTRTGTGILTLTGSNSFSGGLNINGTGINKFTTAAGSNSILTLGTGTVTFNGASTLELKADGTGGTTAKSLITGNGTTGNNVVINAATLIDVNSVTAGVTNGTFQFNNLTIGSSTLSTSGANAYSLQFAGSTTLTSNATFNAGSAGVLLSGAVGDGGNTFGLSKLGTGTLTLNGNNSYTGATTIGTAGSSTGTGTVTVSGANGSIVSSSGYTVTGSGSQLNLDYTSGATTDRLKNTGKVTVNLGGELRSTNATDATNTSETVGSISLGTGHGFVSINQGATGGAVNTLTSAEFTRGSNFGTGVVRGSNLGLNNNTNRGELKLTPAGQAALTLAGTNLSSVGTNTGSDKQLAIVPFLTGSTSASGNTNINFVTYDSTSGFRTIGTTEQNTVALAQTNDNVRTTGATPVTGSKVWNSLMSNHSNASTTVTGEATATLTLTSGALANFSTSNANSDFTVQGFGSIIFGGTSPNGTVVNEAIISMPNTSSGMETYIRSPINTASAGGALTKTGAGTVILTAANLYTGATRVNQGTLTLGDGTAGNLAGSGSTGEVTTISGTTFNLVQASGSTLATNVANAGTFNVTNAGTQTLSGNISGAGGGNFATNAAATTLNLSGANTYTAATTVNGTVNLSGSLSGTAITVNSTGLLAQSGTGSIAGGSSLSVSGTATLLGSNTHSGASGITATGTLQAVSNAGNTASGISSALSSNSVLTLASGSTLQLRGDNNTTFNPSSVNLTSDPTSGADTTTFNIDVNATTAASNKTLTLGGTSFNFQQSSGSRGADQSTLNVTGATGYTLGLGAVLGANQSTAGVVNGFSVASGVNLTIGTLSSASTSPSFTFQFAGAGNTSITGAVSRAANRALTLNFNQTGTVTLNSAAVDGGGANAFVPALNSGTTVFNHGGAVNNVAINLGNQTAASTSAATFLLGGSNGLNGGVSLTSTVKAFDTTSGLLTVGGQNTSGVNTFSNTITLGSTTNIGKSVTLQSATGGQVDFTGAIAQNGTDATAGITVGNAGNAGTVRLAASNTYRGATNLNNGILLAGHANALNTTALGGNVTFTGGTLQYSAAFAGGANGDVSTRIKNSSGAITIDTNGQNVAFASALDNSNTGGLTKLGAGTLALTANNTYSGLNTVSSGKLLANNITGSATGAGNVSVNSTATLGGGNTSTGLATIGTATLGNYAGNTTGIISGNVTVNSAGHLAPGNSVGTLTVGGLSLSGGSILDYEFNNVANDLTVVTTAGGLALNGGGFNLYQEGSNSAYTTNGLYHLIDYSGSFTGSVSNLSVLNGLSSKKYTFSNNAVNGMIDLTIADNYVARLQSGAAASANGTVSITGSNGSYDFTPAVFSAAVTGSVDVVHSPSVTVDNPTIVLLDLGNGVNDPSAGSMSNIAASLASIASTYGFDAGNIVTSGALLSTHNYKLGAGEDWDLALYFTSSNTTTFNFNWDFTGINNGDNASVVAVGIVPEPASFGLIGLASVGILSRRRRRSV